MTRPEKIEDLLTQRPDQQGTGAIVEAFIIALPVIKAAMAIEDQRHKPYTGSRTKIEGRLDRDLFTTLVPWREETE